MANNRCTSQQTYNVSVPKDDLMLLEKIIEDSGVKKKAIAERLDLKTKEVKKSLKTLYEQGIIESGDSEGSFDGYRFTF